ncbi:Hsp33 family molecular chaperone HslO [Clostridiaceae bacterium DONG20-135]|uniref:33 kDa chaperonin n=1 Tax=Copranaerobaculum intestinale TaxID=2692629 RepID=A0A6N8U3I9_9FIRM|nr:Hsp33 family molecular chaperone HslO [Copranaerobaculum intestinale]MXQ72471.1 Hsp33 family molecular chaperone HslO [Copranaerobaculum intestinale]
MEDQLIKALACDGHVRIYICATTSMVEEARTRFDMWPTTAAALGRTLTVGSMMGSMLKSEKEQLTILINGGGPIGTIMVDAYSDGHVRGFVSEPHCHFQYEETGKLAVGIAVGNAGNLEVIKDVGGRDNWKGTVQLQTGEIGDDFAYYFTVSEQTPSAVSVGVLVDTDNHILSAGGMILQMMPDATEEDIAVCEEVLKQLKPMSTIIHEETDLEMVLHDMFGDVKILSKQPVAFRCDCSHAKMKRVLTTLTKEERMQMIEEDHGCEITCNFCNERYQFSEQELRDLEDFIDTYGRT